MFQPLGFAFWLASALISATTANPLGELNTPIVFVQLPAGEIPESGVLSRDGTLEIEMGLGARLVSLDPDGNLRELAPGFAGAIDPEVSFDGTRILFAGKRSPADRWNVFELDRGESTTRQVTSDLGDCRQPIYQSTLYTIVSAEPWYQITFRTNFDGEYNEHGLARSTSLYSCRLNGSEKRRLTFNPSSDLDPYLLQDGRILFASWQRATLQHGPSGHVSLFAVNSDGTDISLFARQGKRIKRMPCVTSGGLVVFVESDGPTWDGAGQLASVSLRRPLRSYESLTRPEDGYFHSPSPLPDGTLLVSRRSPDDGTHGIYRLDPRSRKIELIFDDPDYHDIQVRALLPRREPDGRSSVVTESDPNGQLYCLNSNLNDFSSGRLLPSGLVRRVRVLEGIPRTAKADQSAVIGTRLLGEIPVEEDGSFFLQVPANIPIQLQTLDDNGMALNTCGWIWVRNHEARGCIGCHEDAELAPENVLVDAVKKAPYELTLPAHLRRTVNFRRHVSTIVAEKCATDSCHARAEASLPITSSLSDREVYETLVSSERYLRPGEARTSPLIWHVTGRNTLRSWDLISAQHEAALPDVSSALSDRERNVLVEWIDMGAAWDHEEVRQEGSAAGVRE